MYYFIVNPNSQSRKSEKIWGGIQKELKRRGVEYKKFYTRYPGHTPVLVRQICKTYPGEKTIVYLGGDGTVNEVYNGISDFDNVILGYIPTGSGNDYAGSLGIPSNPLKALDRILETGTVHEIDYCTVTMNGETRLYAGSAGIGFDAEVCRLVEQSKTKHILNKLGLGKLTYLVIALRSLASHPNVSVTVRADDGPSVTYPKTIFVCPMNQPREGGAMILAPAAKMDDGKLTMCTFYGLSKLKVLFALPLTYSGRHIGLTGTRQIDCKTAEIRAEKPLPVHVDGEYIGHTDHAVFRVSQRSVRVIY